VSCSEELNVKQNASTVERAPDGKWISSGNPVGRPLGSRHKIAEAIVRDISDAWQNHGPGVLNRMALTEPAKFAQLAAGLIPKEFMLTIGARLPGNLEPDDWAVLNEVLGAVKQAMPDANGRAPGDVMSFVLDAVRAHDARVIEAHTENPSNGTTQKPA
jgi:hypothetical protein